MNGVADANFANLTTGKSIEMFNKLLINVNGLMAHKLLSENFQRQVTRIRRF
jgi:hypothetical protein